MSTGASSDLRCSRCNRTLSGALKHYRQQGEVRCLRCAVRNGALLRRSLLIALLVGTLLTAINQGDVIMNGTLPSELLWKVPLTYCTPFVVATWSALLNSEA
jgi:hypothetical protein